MAKVQHEVIVRAVKTPRGSDPHWEGACEHCCFWVGVAGLTSKSEDLVRKEAALHEKRNSGPRVLELKTETGR